MKKPSRISTAFLNGSVLLYLIWLLLPVVQKFTHAAAGCLTLCLFAMGVVLDTEYLKRNSLRTVLRAVCAAAVPLCLHFFADRGGTRWDGFLVQQIMFWFPLIFAAYARERGDRALWKYARAVLLGTVTVTVCTTIGWLIEGMMRGGKIYAYSRSLGYAGEGNEAYLTELMLRNIGGYDFVYAMCAALPFTCLGILRSAGKKKINFVVLLVLQTVMIVLSQYTYAMLYALTVLLSEGLGDLLFRWTKGRFSRGKCMVMALLPVLIPVLLAVPLLNLTVSVCGKLGLTGFAGSFSLLLETLRNGSAAEGSRLSYYLVALRGFAASPFTGGIFGGAQPVGGHSDLLDLLSGMGLLGTAAVGGMVWLMGRGSLKGLRMNPDRCHIVLSLGIIFVTALLGTVCYSRDIMAVFSTGALLILEGAPEEAVSE